jgi:phospholipid N-methyltransferase
MDAASRVMHGNHWSERPPLAGDLENFRNNGLSDGFDNISSLHCASPEVSDNAVMGLFAMFVSMMGMKFFKEHYRSGVGNPQGPEVMGQILTISDIQALFNAWQISRHIKQEVRRIVEIGPGFGALAAILRDIYPDAEITLIDLPEHREVVEYYLENTVGMDGISITTELPEGADVVIALRCMMEMPISEVNRYLSWIQENDVSWFYLINRYMKFNVTKNYPFDEYWTPVSTRNDYLTGVLHEFLLERRSDPSDILANQLKTLPPFFNSDKSAIWMRGQLVCKPIGPHL